VQGFCKPLFLSSESVVYEIQKELELLGKNGILAYHVDNSCHTRMCTSNKGRMKYGEVYEN